LPKPSRTESNRMKDEIKSKKDSKSGKSDEALRRYLMLELSCNGQQCSPCTYPNCQRFIREKKHIKGMKTKVMEVKKPEVEIRHERQKTTADRYVLVELACTKAKCSPCTYPNCQRFTRGSKQVFKKKGVTFKVTELKGDKQVQQLIDKEGKKLTEKSVTETV